MDDYLRLADRVAADIASGRLRPGQRLLPQRTFARRCGVAASTAGRVYGELVRRGLVVGEVGRGTFVRATPPESTGARALTEPTATAPLGREPGSRPPVTPVNLELNYPLAPGQSELLAPALAALLDPASLTDALRPAPATGTSGARAAVAELLGVPGHRPVPGQVLFTGNGRQAIAAALASLVRPGGRVGVETLTYPLVKEIAGRLGITLVPLDTDAEGPLAQSVAAAHRSAPLSALYLQPALHNPTARTMPEPRRRAVARVVTDLGIPVVEDRVWSFLRPEVPLAALAPALTHVVDGLSKRVAPRSHRRLSRRTAGAGAGRGRRDPVRWLERGPVRAGRGGAVDRGRHGGTAGGRQAGGRGAQAAAARRLSARIRRTVRPARLLRLVGAARAVAGRHVHRGRRRTRHRRHPGPRLRRGPGAHPGRGQARARVGSGGRSGAGAADTRRRRPAGP
ncbi:uncharacterized protein YjeT (DUF2065 family) [Streptomyces glaucescens]